MIKWAIIFAIISLVSGWLGFGGVSGASATIATGVRDGTRRGRRTTARRSPHTGSCPRTSGSQNGFIVPYKGGRISIARRGRTDRDGV